MAPLTSLTTTTLDNTLGAAFLAVVAASMYAQTCRCPAVLLNPFPGRLYGSTFAQTYMYYHNYPQDSVLNKCSVAILWYVTLYRLRRPGFLPIYRYRLLDTLHLALVVHAIYYYNVTEYGNPLALQFIPLSLKVRALSIPIASSLTSLEQLQVLINVIIVLLVHSCVLFVLDCDGKIIT
jgi:hypothetical protein